MSKQVDAAKQKGREAARAGKREWDCPYPDYRTDRGGVTFSRAFRRAWLKGFREVAGSQGAPPPGGDPA